MEKKSIIVLIDKKAFYLYSVTRETQIGTPSTFNDTSKHEYQ